jgi:hypothetical protein
MRATTQAHDVILDLETGRRSSADPAAAREIRMLTALLAACDPCAYVDGGGHPDLYVDLAVEVSCRLHDDADAVALLDVFPDDASAVAVSRFAGAALDWVAAARP